MTFFFIQNVSIGDFSDQSTDDSIDSVFEVLVKCVEQAKKFGQFIVDHTYIL